MILRQRLHDNLNTNLLKYEYIDCSITVLLFNLDLSAVLPTTFSHMKYLNIFRYVQVFTQKFAIRNCYVIGKYFWFD